TKPLVSESGLDCRLSERGRCRARDHGVDSESEAALPMGPLIGLPRRYRDDIVDRGDSKTMCHPCDPWKIPFDDGRPRCESVVEFGEGLFLQDPGRPPRAVHVESTKSAEVARALERQGVHGAHMAIDSSCDDRAVRRDPIQIDPGRVPPVGPLRFIPVDADDPFPCGCPRRGLPEACQGVLHGPGPAEAGPSDLSALSAIWACASMKPGTTTRPWRSMRRVRRPAHRSTWVSVPAATKRSSRIAMACAQGRTPAAVKILPPTNTRFASRAIARPRPAILGDGRS